jgi:hypothetical protein
VSLPHYLAQSLAGLSARIYQTIHEGALAFLVVVCSDRRDAQPSEPSDNAESTEKSDWLYTAKVPDSNSGEPIVLLPLGFGKKLPDGLELKIRRFP